MKRGWCRLEQWARLSIAGQQNMYVYESGKLEPLSTVANWKTDSLAVFAGNFTVDADKEVLVDVILGLWGYSLLNDGKEYLQEVHRLVENQKNAVFPQEWFGNLIDVVEAHVLNLKTKDHETPEVGETPQYAGIHAPISTRKLSAQKSSQNLLEIHMHTTPAVELASSSLQNAEPASQV